MIYEFAMITSDRLFSNIFASRLSLSCNDAFIAFAAKERKKNKIDGNYHDIHLFHIP